MSFVQHVGVTMSGAVDWDIAWARGNQISTKRIVDDLESSIKL